MRLQSAERLASFLGPERDKKMSQRRLARYIGKHPSFVNHLTSGRCRSCEPRTAELIAEALEVPLGVLFVPETASTGRSSVEREQVPA